MAFCINCDNRHGCKSKTPPCIELMRADGVKGACGKGYLIDKKKLDLCKDCDFFYSCWNETDYNSRKSS